MQRAKLLPAQVEVMLAVGDVPAARGAADELTGIAERYATPALHAVAGHAGGAVLLAEGDTRAALASLRRAWTAWQEIQAPYEAARGCWSGSAAGRSGTRRRGAGTDAARGVFAQLGATPDLARLEVLAGRQAAADAHRLTARELHPQRRAPVFFNLKQPWLYSPG